MAEELRLVPKLAHPSSPTLRDLVAVIFRQRRLVLISFVLIFISVLLYGLFSPIYESEMKVLVRKGRVDPVVTPTPSRSEFIRDEITEQELNSEAELLHDQEILRTVVRSSGLISLGQSWWRTLLGDTEEKQLVRAARRVDRRLIVEPVRKATLIAISYQCSNPAQATKALQALAAAYLERHQQVHRPSGEFNFFDQQVAQSRHALEQAELQLMQFTRDEGVVSASLERDIALQKLNAADADDRQSRVTIAEVAARAIELEQKLNLLPERTLTTIRNSDNPQLMEKMKAHLLELQLKRTELLAKYEPSYRPVRELDQEIDETKASIETEEHAPIRDETSDLDANHAWAKSELVKAQVQLKALNAHAEAESMSAAHYRQDAQVLGDRAIQQDHLMNDLKAAEEEYLLYMNKREEARIGDALDQGGILNVTIAEQPTVPVLPKLSLFSFMLIGVVVGGVASTGLAFGADYLNPALQTPEHVIACLGAPVLASLPRTCR